VPILNALRDSALLRLLVALMAWSAGVHACAHAAECVHPEQDDCAERARTVHPLPPAADCCSDCTPSTAQEQPDGDAATARVAAAPTAQGVGCDASDCPCFCHTPWLILDADRSRLSLQGTFLAPEPALADRAGFPLLLDRPPRT